MYVCFFRFQNRRTKWKKTENISNSDVAEHKLCTRKMSLDHNQKQVIVDNTSNTCSSTSSNNTSSKFPLIYFNPFIHLFQSNEGSCSISSSRSTSIHDNENLKSRSCSR